jgi:hypothetical protein
MHMIQNACNLRYKDAYTSCYICHAKCKKCTKESYIHMLQRSSHTQSSQTTGSSRGGGQKGLDTTSERAKEHKTHKLPLNSCIKAKEHTKLTLHTWDRAESKINQVAWPRPQTWRSQIHSPLSFIHNSLILVDYPRKWCSYMSPPVGVLDRQPTKGSTRSRWMWPRRDR